MWSKIVVALVVFWTLFGAGAAEAVSFEPKDFTALTREADQIVIGVAVAANARRTGAREIVTDYRFADLEVVKGNASGETITLTMLGGTVAAESLSVAGAPTFERGNRYLIFIAGNGSVMFPLVGGHQGIFQIRRDALTGLSRIHDYAGRNVTGLPGKVPESLLDRVGADSVEAMSEGTFVEAIRASIGRESGQ